MTHAGSIAVAPPPGEEALAAALVSHWKVKPENILGLSTQPGKASQFGLKNRSDQGIDMLVYVPPPPSMTVRNPTTGAMRHHIDGIKGTAPVETLKFEEGTLLVIEVKTTLGKSRTPGFLKTQAHGGEKNLKRILNLINKPGPGWNKENLKNADKNFPIKLEAIEQQLIENKISYLHAQVFFDHKGNAKFLTGNTKGIQINTWSQHE